VATRPGFPRQQLESVLAQLDQPERVRFFEIAPTPVASRELRDTFADEDVPSAVAEIIRREHLYAH
jgi:nicotinic acid mononucleotide adenylyltransferase